MRRTMRTVRWMLGLATVLGTASIVLGQSRGTMIMDDGETRRVLHFSEPDTAAALRPDVTLADLPLFERLLVLSDPQSEAVRRLIDQYLDDLAALAEDHPLVDEAQEDDGPVRRVRRGGAPPQPPVPPVPGGIGSREAADPIQDILLEELRGAGFDVDDYDDFPYPGRISVGVDVQDDGDGPVPNVNVGISFGGEDDSIPDEVREKLQAAANAAVPRISEHMMERVSQQMGGILPGPGEEMNGIEAKWAELADLRDRIAALLAAKAALYRGFEAQAQTLLAEEQVERWPALDRALTRTHTLPLGELDGESTDLIAIIADSELSDIEEERVAPVLDEYDRELHRALVRRNALLLTSDGDIDLAMYEGDGQKALATADRVTKARVAVRTINDRYLALAADQLEPASAADVRDEAFAESFPRIYRTTIAQRAFSEAAKLDLEDDVRLALIDLRTEHAQQLAAINMRLDRNTRKQQAEELHNDLERAIELTEGGEWDGEAVQTALADDFRARQDLDVRYMKSLYRLLSPEQIASLPRVPTFDVADPVIAEHAESGAWEDY